MGADEVENFSAMLGDIALIALFKSVVRLIGIGKPALREEDCPAVRLECHRSKAIPGERNAVRRICEGIGIGCREEPRGHRTSPKNECGRK